MTSKATQKAEMRSALIAVTIFPVVISGAAIFGLVAPNTASVITPYVPPLLGLIMFGMGLTLTIPDFKVMAKHPASIALGVAVQYVIMPLAAFVIVHLLNLPPALAIGVILVGSAPGGTASNVISYLAKADVALSVTLTSITTFLSPFLTPLLVSLLADTSLEIDAGAMSLSIIKSVLLPVLAGLLVRTVIPRVVEFFLPAIPWLSTIFISTVVAGVVPGSADAIRSAGALAFLAVVLHNGFGLIFGYWTARLVKSPKASARTISIEVGMQNSGLAATLASQYFSALSGAALPAALFSVWHNLSGAVLAAFYRNWAEAEATAEAKALAAIPITADEPAE